MPELQTALPSVFPDVEMGMGMLIDHLQTLGHRRLLYFGPQQKPGSDQARHQRRDAMFQQVVDQRGLQGQLCLYNAPAHHTEFDNWHSVEDQIAALESYLSRQPPPFTAVVCYNDIHAVSACRVLERRGLRVPADVSVTGIDNRDPSTMRPTMTSLDLRLIELGLCAGQMVLEMIEGGEKFRRKYRGQMQYIEPRLYTRESTGSAKNK